MSGGSVERKFQISSGVSNKGATGARVIMETVPLMRGVDAVVGAEVGSAVGPFSLRSVVICSGDSGEEICLVVWFSMLESEVSSLFDV